VNLQVHFFQYGNVRSRWITEVHILDNDMTLDVFGFEATRRGRIDFGDTINGRKDVVGGTACVSESWNIGPNVSVSPM
jgi:hypothetical protein